MARPSGDRRAPERPLYSGDQLLGRQPIRLRRRSDRIRLAGHLGAAVLLIALTGWWVVPLHAFAGPVVLMFGAGHGVHVGDLAVLGFLALAARSVLEAGRLVAAQ